jgi:RNA polymerase sigma-70 factor, ECF subfamily
MTSCTPAQPAGLERAQERRPERPILAVSDPKAEDLAAAVTTHAGGHDHSLGHDAAVDSCLAVGGVHEHIGEALAGQGAVPEGGHLAVEISADPRDLRFGDAAIGTQRFDQVVDLAGAHPVQIRLHHDREQGLINPAAPLQQRGEERPCPQFGDPQLQIPRRGAQHAGPMAVALGETGVGALMGCSADHVGELGLDQGLVDGLGSLADAVIDLRGRECIQDLQQCRLVKGHRALCPFARTISRGLADHRTVATSAGAATPSRPLLPTPLHGTPLPRAEVAWNTSAAWGVFALRPASSRGAVASAGDDFDAFYAASYRRLVGQLFVVLGDLNEAEDVVQEAFTRAAARWSRIRAYDAPEAWVRRVALHQAFTVLRRAKRQLRLLGRLAPSREPPELPSDVVDVLAAMRRLPANQREVLVLHYLVELTLDEVARHLRIPGGTVRSRLARGRRALAMALGLDDSREDVRHA